MAERLAVCLHRRIKWFLVDDCKLCNCFYSPLSVRHQVSARTLINQRFELDLIVDFSINFSCPSEESIREMLRQWMRRVCARVYRWSCACICQLICVQINSLPLDSIDRSLIWLAKWIRFIDSIGRHARGHLPIHQCSPIRWMNCNSENHQQLREET